jgi:hypothetical protein
MIQECQPWRSGRTVVRAQARRGPWHARAAEAQRHPQALRRLAAGTPVDPNDTAMWRSSDAHATGVLRRHGITTLDSMKLSDRAVNELIAGQRDADRRAVLEWGVLHDPPDRRPAARRAPDTSG